MLQMASVYGVQQTAKQAPAFMLPHVAEVSQRMLFNDPPRFRCVIHPYYFAQQTTSYLLYRARPEVNTASLYFV